MKKEEALLNVISLLFRAHPWHGVHIGDDAPAAVNAYVEMVPNDHIKYELDKESGLLKVDRPQKFSSMPPMLYGFIPQTYCGNKIAQFCMEKSSYSDIVGDGDPLDICIFTERAIEHSNILVPVVPVGGFRMIDGNEADDKIIATLKGDLVFGQWQDILDVPSSFIERLRHYFLTYKDIPGAEQHNCQITHLYNREEAHEVIRLSQEDYRDTFPALSRFKVLTKALR